MRSVVIEVTEVDILPPRFRYRPASPWSGRVLGLVVTVLVHVIGSAPLVLGYAAQERRQPAAGPGSVDWASHGEQVESMILLDLSALSAQSAPDTPIPLIDADGITPDEQSLELVSIDVSPPPDLQFEEDEAEQASTASGDPAANAALFGRYMGHVAARIDRAWERPRAPVEGGRFTCTALIVQDRAGNVLSVALTPCDADSRWRASLETAIRRSSPIASPPEPWLFTSSLTLAFTSDQYVTGQSSERLYEPAPKRLAVQATAPAQGIPVTLAPGDYELVNSENGVVLRPRTPAAKTNN